MYSITNTGDNGLAGCVVDIYNDLTYTQPIIYTAEEPKTPDVKYPGDDPTKAPDGTVWKGKGEQGSKEGNYTNPETGESWHPDLDHDYPIGPHWDYNYRKSGTKGWRVFSDGRIELKQ